MRALLRALLIAAVVAGVAGPAAAARRGKARTQDRAPEPPARTSRTAEPDTGGEIKRGERIEFDERLIQGQTAKAGALYIFDRKPNVLRSMVNERESYRDEIVQQIFPDQEGTP